MNKKEFVYHYLSNVLILEYDYQESNKYYDVYNNGGSYVVIITTPFYSKKEVYFNCNEFNNLIKLFQLNFWELRTYIMEYVSEVLNYDVSNYEFNSVK